MEIDGRKPTSEMLEFFAGNGFDNSGNPVKEKRNVWENGKWLGEYEKPGDFVKLLVEATIKPGQSVERVSKVFRHRMRSSVVKLATATDASELDRYKNQELRRVLEESIVALDEDEQEVFRGRFGLNEKRELRTFSDLSNEMNKPVPEIKDLENISLIKMSDLVMVEGIMESVVSLI